MEDDFGRYWCASYSSVLHRGSWMVGTQKDDQHDDAHICLCMGIYVGVCGS